MPERGLGYIPSKPLGRRIKEAVVGAPKDVHLGIEGATPRARAQHAQESTDRTLNTLMAISERARAASQREGERVKALKKQARP